MGLLDLSSLLMSPHERIARALANAPPMPAPARWQVSPWTINRGKQQPAGPPQMPELPGAMPESSFNFKKPEHGLLHDLQAGLMPSPQGMDGLLSPEDVHNAQTQGLLGIGAGLLANAGPKTAAERVPLMAALSQGLQNGRNTYSEALQSAAGMRGAALDMKNKQLDVSGKERDQQLQTQRDAILKALPQPDGKDPEAMVHWADAVVPHLLNAGLTDDATKVMQMRKLLDTEPQAVQLGDQATTYVPGKGFWDDKQNKFVPSIERHMMPDQLALKQQALDLSAARADAANANLNNTRMDRLATTWDKNNQDIFKRVQPVNQALMALDAAKTQPVVGYTAALAFLTAVDPKAQQRYQMVHWADTHLTPALSEKFKRMMSEKTTGLIPRDLLEAMETHVKRTRDITIQQETRAYNEYVKMHPQMKDQLRRISTEFTPDAPADNRPPLGSFHR